MFIFTDLKVVIIVLAMVGKFCINVSFGIIYLFSGEISPTVVRNIGVSSCSFWARIGGMVAPYIGSLVRFSFHFKCVFSQGLFVVVIP